MTFLLLSNLPSLNREQFTAECGRGMGLEQTFNRLVAFFDLTKFN